MLLQLTWVQESEQGGERTGVSRSRRHTRRGELLQHSGSSAQTKERETFAAVVVSKCGGGQQVQWERIRTVGSASAVVGVKRRRQASKLPEMGRAYTSKVDLNSRARSPEVIASRYSIDELCALTLTMTDSIELGLARAVRSPRQVR